MRKKRISQADLQEAVLFFVYYYTLHPKELDALCKERARREREFLVGMVYGVKDEKKKIKARSKTA